MKTKVYPVKIQSATPYGGAYLIEDYNGNKDYFPKSTVFNVWENEVYIAEWILKKKSITYSCKKPHWYNSETGNITPQVTVEVIKTTPTKIEFDPNNGPDESLIK